MSVYVAQLFDTTWADKRKWPYARSCHLTASTPEELHAFAMRLGLKRRWAQGEGGPGWRLHYDLTASKRAMALRLGAIEVDGREHFAARRDAEREGSTDGR